jgi:two-component system response regulator YesN
VTDIVMPDMSGIELAEQMMDQYPLIGVVLLSGYTTESRELNHATARGETFLLKPVTSTQLLHAVLRGIASRRATAESQAVS